MKQLIKKLFTVSIIFFSAANFAAACMPQSLIDFIEHQQTHDRLSNPDMWMERLWAWADEFNIPEKELPRNEKDLLAMTKLAINNHHPINNPLVEIYLPPEIGQLKNLQYISLSNNEIQTLPAEIGQLSNLRYIYLLNNEIQTLPAEIGQLKNLQYLYLSKNKLQTLPAEIGQLSNLQKLVLIGNKLQTLPTEIGQLSNLQTLDLHGNKIQSLPAEIGQLSNLQTLDLYGNKIQSLPAEIGQLRNLQVLMLWNNQLLESLPETFIHLNNLEKLDISFNPKLKLTHDQKQFIDGIEKVVR